MQESHHDKPNPIAGPRLEKRLALQNAATQLELLHAKLSTPPPRIALDPEPEATKPPIEPMADPQV